MPDSHDVQEGEHISAIALLHGFTNWHVIWDDGGNAQLRNDRKYHHALHPGDSVCIPDKTDKTESRPTGKVHPFVLDTTPLYLRLKLEDLDGTPLANSICALLLEDPNTNQPANTDGDGISEHEIKKLVKQGSITAMPDDKPPIKYDLNIGSLRDQNTFEGQRQRLNNLGYFAGYSKDDTDQFWWAAEEFLCENDKARVTKTPTIDPDKGVVDDSGNPDAGFVTKLVTAHGV